MAFRRGLEWLGLQLMNRNNYDADAAVQVRDYGLELWPGSFTTISQKEDNLMLNVDVVHKVLR